ncbi:MAG: hypothetical protein IPM37_22990 [Hahellaceae bacterium]|nr:hypothetical protein [Hahellaceae bacterium]
MSELRDRSILLVDQGFRRSNQAEMCQQARLAGFTRLSIVKGDGSRSSSGRDLNGHLQALSELHRIRADAFLVEAMRNRVTLLAEPAVLARLKKLLQRRQTCGSGGNHRRWNSRSDWCCRNRRVQYHAH